MCRQLRFPPSIDAISQRLWWLDNTNAAQDLEFPQAHSAGHGQVPIEKRWSSRVPHTAKISQQPQREAQTSR